MLPADLNNPNDPKVFVVDPRSPEAWKTQVLLVNAGSLNPQEGMLCGTSLGLAAAQASSLSCGNIVGTLLLAAIEAFGASQLSEHSPECSQLRLLASASVAGQVGHCDPISCTWVEYLVAWHSRPQRSLLFLRHLAGVPVHRLPVRGGLSEGQQRGLRPRPGHRCATLLVSINPERGACKGDTL